MHLKLLSDITIIIMIYTGINSCTKGVGFAEAIKSCVKKMHYFLCWLIFVCCCFCCCCCIYSEVGTKSIECSCVCIISLPPAVQQRIPCCTIFSHDGSSYTVVEPIYNVTDCRVGQLKSWFTPNKRLPLNVVVFPWGCGSQPFCCWLGVLSWWCWWLY